MAGTALHSADLENTVPIREEITTFSLVRGNDAYLILVSVDKEPATLTANLYME